MRILCGTLLFVSRFSTLSSQSNHITQLRALGELGVRQLGIGIGIGNIFTLATFTSVGVGDWKSTNDYRLTPDPQLLPH